MFNEARMSGWQRWREAAFATCTAWLVVQNVGLLALVAWGRPATALAAGDSIARNAVTPWRAAQCPRGRPDSRSRRGGARPAKRRVGRGGVE
jgi:hypothetical protein